MKHKWQKIPIYNLDDYKCINCGISILDYTKSDIEKHRFCYEVDIPYIFYTCGEIIIRGILE